MRVIVLLLLLMIGNAQAACSGSSPTRTAASSGRTDVNDCVTVAVDGDTINIPAGTSTWATPITVSGKALSIIGAGPTSTVINGTNTEAWVIVMSANECFRLSNMGFTGTGGNSTGQIEETKINIRGSIDCFRGDNLKFTNNGPGGGSSGAHGVWVGLFDTILKQPRMLFDHIDFQCATGSVAGFCRFAKFECQNSNWTKPDRAGSDEFIFIEDSSFTWTGAPDTNYGVTDTEYGCRIVVRNNNITGGGIQVHDFGSTEASRGNRYAEVYGNTFSCGSISTCSSVPFIGVRGGGWLIYNNIIPSGYGTSGILAQVYRGTTGGGGVGAGYIGTVCGSVAVKACAASPTYSFYHCSVSPFQGLDYSGSTCSGGTSTLTATSSASCAANEYLPDIDRVDGGSDTTGYPCRDQTGRGQEYANHTKQYASQVYWWGNTRSGSPLNLTSSDNQTNYFVINRDFCNVTPATSTTADGRTSYVFGSCGVRPAWRYTPWFYPHPWQTALQLRPSGSVTGVGQN